MFLTASRLHELDSSARSSEPGGTLSLPCWRAKVNWINHVSEPDRLILAGKLLTTSAIGIAGLSVRLSGLMVRLNFAILSREIGSMR
jgi:hypothetical protein